MNAATTQSAPRGLEAAPYRWTVAALYRAIDAGVFDHPERIELIEGELIEKMGQNPAHASLISRLTRRLRAALEPQLTVREEKPLHIADDGEPVPDIMIVVGPEDNYDERHPTPADVAVLVEVADTSGVYDTRDKALLYAQAGIAEYWVVLLSSQEILIHRQPEAGGYGSIARLAASDQIAPLAAPDARFRVGQLLSR